MIVIVGSPVGQEADGGIVAAGPAVGLGRVAAAAGREVQLVGKVGEDEAGDAVILSLAGRGIGHVALLRDAGRSTPVAARSRGSAADEAIADVEPDPEPPAGLPLEAADLELALRYLPDYRVIVVAVPLEPATTEPIVAASRWAGAQLIAIVAAGERPAELTTDATVLEAPASDPEGAFAAIVGAYAAALDRGAPPAEAFEAVSGGLGVTPVRD